MADVMALRRYGRDLGNDALRVLDRMIEAGGEEKDRLRADLEDTLEALNVHRAYKVMASLAGEGR